MALFRGFGARKDSTRGTAAIETRKDIAGLIMPTVEASRVGAYAGVMPAFTTLVVGAASFAYVARGFHVVTTRGASDGAQLWGNDGDVTISTADDGSSLAAPSSGQSRIDVIYALHPSSGENADTSSQPVVAVAKGTPSSVPVAPSIPAGAVELARNTMTSSATSTSSAGNSIQQTFKRTALRGTPVVVRDDGEAAALASAVQAFGACPLMVWHMGRARYEVTVDSGVTWLPLTSGGLIGQAQSAAQKDLGTSLDTIVAVTFPAIAGRSYRVFGYAEGTQVTNTGTALVRVRISEAGQPSRDVDQVIYDTLTATRAASGSAAPVFTATTTGTCSVSLIGNSSSPAFRILVGAARISVEDVTR